MKKKMSITDIEEKGQEEKQAKGQKVLNTLGVAVDTGLMIENARVRLQVRQSHLKLQKRKDPVADKLLTAVGGLEEDIDKIVSDLLNEHPAYPWFSQIKGVGKENIGKVIGLIDIEKADTISSLWKFAGYAVDPDGHAPRRVKGKKLEYNARLRTMCWRMASSLLRAKGSYYKYYLSQKELLEIRKRNEGFSIVPAAKLPRKKIAKRGSDGAVQVKDKREESSNVISEGHIHNMALRKMIKLFLAHLWLVWREEAGLPLTKPYAIDKMKHKSFITAYEMVDKKAKTKKVSDFRHIKVSRKPAEIEPKKKQPKAKVKVSKRKKA
jgi:hypothetical protein